MIEIVNENWIVIAHKKRDAECDYVLSLIPDNNEFAIHTVRIDTPKNLFWGHYHATFESVINQWIKL